MDNEKLEEVRVYTINKKLEEGQVYTVDKELVDTTMSEIGTEIQDGAKIEPTEKQSFEDYKMLYYGEIKARCKEEYGTAEDADLINDIAKEMYLSQKTYIPDDTQKPKEDLEDKILNESKELCEEYKYLNKCSDYETVKNSLTKEILDNIENILEQYETDLAIEDIEGNNVQAVINWYEGLTNTEDFINEIGGKE